MHFTLKTFPLLFSFLVCVLSPVDFATGQSGVIEVSTISELSNAIASAKPGDIIVMSEGSWKDAVIHFNAKASESKTITLRAKVPGKVILTGSSRLIFGAPYLVVDGLYFKDGALNDSDLVKFTSNNCRLTNTAIENYNPTDPKTSYYWVYFDGEYNRMDNCYFAGKNHAQPLIGNDHKESRHNTVDHCYFKDIPYTDGGNGREIFRVWGYGGNEELGDDGAYFTIEYNLFDHADGEGSEIISLKSNRNVVRFNTILETRGGIVNRSGNFNVIEGNFILGNNRKGTSGIRVAGQFHQVINNYVSEVEGDGLTLMVGEHYEESLTTSYEPIEREGTRLGRVPRYGHVRNVIFAHNTLVDVGGTALEMASSYKGSWPKQQRVLLPEKNIFANNIFKTKGSTVIHLSVQDRNPPLNVFNFQPNDFKSNILFGGELEIYSMPHSAIKVEDPKLVQGKDGLFRPERNSPVINNGFGSTLATDIDGQVRDSPPDIGADEYSNNEIKQKPLTPGDVGPFWMRKSVQ